MSFRNYLCSRKSCSEMYSNIFCQKELQRILENKGNKENYRRLFQNYITRRWSVNCLVYILWNLTHMCACLHLCGMCVCVCVCVCVHTQIPTYIFIYSTNIKAPCFVLGTVFGSLFSSEQNRQKSLPSRCLAWGGEEGVTTVNKPRVWHVKGL